MMDWQDMNLAKATFATLCRALDGENWKYDADAENLQVRTGVQGEDLPIEMTFSIIPDKMLILLTSHLPFVTPEDKRLDMAIAVSMVNNMLAHGCFDFDLQSGHTFFRLPNSFIESRIGSELFVYMLLASCKMVDEYNDKFLMLGKGLISLEQFLASVQP